MKYCLIGEKLSHSYSCDIHNFTGLNYSLKEVDKKNLKSFCQNCEYDGFNVTVPYKESIISYLDKVSSVAKEIGCVNIVSKKGNKLYGDNTDILGLEYVFNKNKINVSGKDIVILGSGGTSKTSIYFAKKHNARNIYVVSRSGKINYQNCYEYISNCHILINATPVGMYPNIFDCIIDLKRLKKLQFVFDCVYNPLNTKLLLQAQKLKIKNSNGLDMLIKQAFEGEKLWGFDNDSKKHQKIKQIKGLLINNHQNIVLYGMPSCGKTTIGRLVAEKLHRPFYDSDIEIEKTFNSSPKEIIIKHGEQKFRELECEVIKKLSTITGAVISLGGGSVLNSTNIDNLSLNGFFIYIKRQNSLLIADDRPLSVSKGIKNLYQERKVIYNNIYNVKVKNNGTIEKTVGDIIKKYENSCYKRG